MKNKLFIALLTLTVGILLVSLALAQEAEVKYCCEKTTYGAWCMNAPEEKCSSDYRKAPTSCESTSYCKLGTCYDSSDGICMENTPQKVCNDDGGTWSSKEIDEVPQCQLGCCLLGSQASFVTLTRCKKLSSFYGLNTDFRRNVNSEMQCISLASQQDEGACVYSVDYIKTCKFTTRQECNSITSGNGTMTGNVTFHKDFLCSNDDLETNCGPTEKTTCVDGKDEVYFVDSCGNIANIYDSSKIYDEDPAYWNEIVKKEDSCNSGANINSKTCGNCNYFEGSICKESENQKPVYGNYICSSLNCESGETSDGKPHKHGESWCSTDENKDSVGSRYFRHLCINGEEIIEPCADFRQEVCIEDTIETNKGSFSQAACRVNRWQDCYSQTEKIDCENEDKRDCKWILDKDEVEYQVNEETGMQEPKKMGCVPESAPGLKFWQGGEAEGICSQANSQCVVTYEEKGIIGSEEDCKENCYCLTEEWKQEQLEKCESLGDCGSKINFVGQEGNKDGYKIKTDEEETEEESGGLFGMHLVLDKLGMGHLVKEKENKEEK